MSVLWRECPQWTLWAPCGDSLQCCMCFYRDANYLQPINFLTLEANCHCILVAAQYCFLIKKIWICCRILNLQDCPQRISLARSAHSLPKASWCLQGGHLVVIAARQFPPPLWMEKNSGPPPFVLNSWKLIITHLKTNFGSPSWALKISCPPFWLSEKTGPPLNPPKILASPQTNAPSLPVKNDIAPWQFWECYSPDRCRSMKV